VKLGDILVRRGVITSAQRDEALERQRVKPGQRIGELLVEAGWCTEPDVLFALAEQYHVTAVPLVDDAWIDPGLIRRIPVDWSRQNLMMPVRWDGEVGVLMADPAMLSRLGEVALMLACEPVALLATAAEIRRVIDHAYFERTPDQPAPVAAPEPPREARRADDLLRVTESAPVTQLLNTILLDAVRKKASDVHIEPYENHLRVRFRIDGFLYEQTAPPKPLEDALVSRIKVMSNLDIAERRLPQDGMAKVRAGEREIDIRVSTVPVAEGERVVLRLLNMSSTLLPLGDLGMPEPVRRRITEAAQFAHGMVLVTGPTGSGKTTTLYAALQSLDTAHLNVLTVEDPIEYQMADIGQIQVKPKIGLTFASGLRHILRQDPDVILVGEIRDRETAEIAVRAALTGHLVFSTLHTNDAASALIRLTDMGVEPFLVSSCVRLVLAQRLVRRLCPACRRAAPVDEAVLGNMQPPMAEALRGRMLYYPVGCPSCTAGYRGRVGLYEAVTVPGGTAGRTGFDLDALRRSAEAEGTTMWADARTKLLDGVTSLDEVRRVMETALTARPA
jgi:type II secretory ATPase GspE/PulE/Tfp pilus assembly ATPase PilB-like protein